MLKSLKIKAGTFHELLSFLWKERIFWLIPMVIILVLLALLMVFAQSTPVAPFIYTLF